jgi:predicted  nucleic acid-binding Zn-ribbon protein
MPYREELEAAYAQIAALEVKIATLQLEITHEFTEKEFTELAQKLMEEQSKEQRKAAALQESLQEQGQRLTEEQRRAIELEVSLREQGDELAEARQQIQQHEKTLAELHRRVRNTSTPSSERLPSLFEYNRNIKSSSIQGIAANVLCPECLNFGEQVEMLLNTERLPSPNHSEARCPRCLFSGWKKL